MTKLSVLRKISISELVILHLFRLKKQGHQDMIHLSVSVDDARRLKHLAQLQTSAL